MFSENAVLTPLFNRYMTSLCSRILFAATALVGLTTIVQAQTSGGEIEDLQITIDKSRTITLPEILPDPTRVPLPVKPVVVPKQKYNYVEYNVKLPESEPKIKVLTMKGETIPTYPALHLRAGFGLPVATYAELMYRSSVKKNISWGLHGKHYALFQGPERKVASGYNENFLRGYTTYYSDPVIIDGALEYRRDGYNFYGLPKETERGEDSVRQFFQFIKAQVNFSQNLKTGPFSWAAGVNFSNMNDAYKAKEYVLDFHTNLGYDLDSISGIKTTVLLFNSRRTDSSDQARSALWLRPTYFRQMGDLSIELGFGLALDNDTFGNAPRFHLYPNIKANLVLIPKVLSLEAGITGDLDKQTLQQQVAVNPWLAPNVALAHTNRKLDVYGGLDIAPTKALNIKARVAYRQLQNLPLFYNQFSDSSRFGILYDRGTVNQLQVIAAAGYKFSDKAEGQLTAEFNNYKMGDAAKPWHLPALKLGGSFAYKVTPEWHTSARVNYQGDMLAPAAFNAGEVKVPGMLNLGLRTQYIINQKFTAFADLDNLLNQQNQRYLYYPTRGILFMIGGSFTLLPPSK